MALFDFTSLFASENAARIVERKGRRILLCVAGDSLNEVRCNASYVVIIMCTATLELLIKDTRNKGHNRKSLSIKDTTRLEVPNVHFFVL